MKIDFRRMGKALGRAAKRAAPALAIGLGVGCTAVAAYKTAKAVPVAKAHIQERKDELGVEKLPIKETVLACYKDFKEPVIFGTVAVASVTSGICGYEKTLKDLGTTIGTATALLSEQKNEMQKALGEAKTEEVQQKAISNVAKSDIYTSGARIPTPGGSEIFIEDVTGREYTSSESWIRECFSRYMDDFIDNPDDRPPLSDFYDILAPNVKKSGAPIANYLSFPYDVTKPSKYNRVELYFEPGETVDGKAAFVFKYSRPLEYTPM